MTSKASKQLESNSPPRGRLVLAQVGVIVASVLLGVALGIVARPVLIEDKKQDTKPPHAHGPEIESVHLTKQALANLNLKVESPKLSKYRRYVSMPGVIVEMPGVSDLTVSAPVSGIIQQVRVRNGQSTKSGERLFRLQITDRDLISAQTRLLNILSQLDTKNLEAERLASLATTNSVLKSKQRELDYALKQLVADRDVARQEILARGLPAPSLARIMEQPKLIEQLDVKVPEYDIGNDESLEDIYPLTVQSIEAKPGLQVERGQTLCEVANHRILQVRGDAFENDMQTISQAMNKGWKVLVEFGHRHDGTRHMEELPITRIDNHFNIAEQTYGFFLRLTNRESGEPVERDGRMYREWLYKPGQRIHLSVPVEELDQQLVLPVDAVAQEGPNAYVFREHFRSLREGPLPPDIFVEFIPTPVQVLRKDAHVVVISDDPKRSLLDSKIAFSGAHKLHLALKTQNQSEEGHSHPH